MMLKKIAKILEQFHNPQHLYTTFLCTISLHHKVVDAKITFEEKDGKVTNLVLHQNGQDMPAVKTK